MVSIDTLSMVVPLMLLLVLKLCDIARNIDLSDNIDTEGWFPSLPNDEIGFGPFVFIHTANFTMVMMLFLMVSDRYGESLLSPLLTRYPSNILFHISYFVLFIWLILPLLEIGEYRNMSRGKFGLPRSFFSYFITVGLLAGIVRLARPLRQVRPDTPNTLEYIVESINMVGSNPELVLIDLGIALIGVLLFLASTIGFVVELQEDLNRSEIETKTGEEGHPEPSAN